MRVHKPLTMEQHLDIAIAHLDSAIEMLADATAPRHTFEVYDSRNGIRLQHYPVDVADEATARQAAYRKAAEWNSKNATDPYVVRELGRPDSIAPGEFDKAILLGYKVELTDDGWMVGLPDDATDPDPVIAFATEREAWHAADNHRMFGNIAGPGAGRMSEPKPFNRDGGAEALRLMSGWQPIESAPRDGTVIDIWVDSGRRIADVRWGEPPADDAGEDAEEGWLVGGRYARGEDEWPTHWMPRPPPPESGT